MALKKSKQLPNGFTAEYWKITNISCDRLKLKAVYTIALFKDKDASDTGKAPSLSKLVNISITKQESEGDLVAAGYTKIKAKANTPVEKSGSRTHEMVPGDADLVGCEDA